MHPSRTPSATLAASPAPLGPLHASPGLAPLRVGYRHQPRRRPSPSQASSTVVIVVAPAGTPAPARLLVHLPRCGAGRWSFGALLRRLRGQAGSGAERWSLQLLDAQGRRLLSVEDSRMLVDITLAPGTYEVIAATGGTRRSYTVALADAEVAALQPRLEAAPY